MKGPRGGFLVRQALCAATRMLQQVDGREKLDGAEGHHQGADNQKASEEPAGRGGKGLSKRPGPDQPQSDGKTESREQREWLCGQELQGKYQSQADPGAQVGCLGSAVRQVKGPGYPRCASRVVVKVAEGQHRPAEGKNKGGEQRSSPALFPASRQAISADCAHGKVPDEVHRVGEIDREQDEEERGRIKEKKVGVREHGLPIIQVRAPIWQRTVP